MDCVSEYNVVEGMLGLGEYILLEILSEMKLPQDVQQFLLVCRKIHKLQEHPRFQKIIQLITIDPIIREGIVKIEIIFENPSQNFGMGIADASCSFAAGYGPSAYGNEEKTVRYFRNGELNHITYSTKGNLYYFNKQRISAIVDMTSNPHKVVFQVNDIEQPNYVIGIPSEIRFWVLEQEPQKFGVASPQSLEQGYAIPHPQEKHWSIAIVQGVIGTDYL
ncbi:MAG: hypothetical protein EZS28_021184 [Streblomastix strix]|uniref:F-box domain-containing protein n=1 Tax=Streblomastix strix TaxID=222440 RepID=A0A5J4VL14_9EUKA|nr:MAG: hypothetical protein EZS28_021184 [Streblomastix strix]